MTRNPLAQLQTFIDEKWATVQPHCFPKATEGWRLTPHAEVPPLSEAITPDEASYFLSAITVKGSRPPLLAVHNNNKLESDRYPAIGSGRSRGYVFFEKSGPHMGGIRLETIVQWAAIAKLCSEFGWPRDHIVCESPTVVRDGHDVLDYDALDILALEAPSIPLTAKMAAAALPTQVAIEAKATPKMLNHLIAGMLACHADATPHDRTDHVKCNAVDVLRPRFFLGVAARETWRIFTVGKHDGRHTLGEELTPDLRALHFGA